MSGNIALLRLPDDHRLHVQLSTYFYASTLAKLRRDIIGQRSGIAVFEVAVPINVPVIECAMDRRSTYLLGYRQQGADRWWAFHEPERALPDLPHGAVQSMQLTGSYTELGLPTVINMRPELMLTVLANYAGRPDPRFCQAIVLLLFLVAEALRFDSVLMECARYFSAGTHFAFTIHPRQFASIVQNWAASPPGHADVLLPYLP